MALLADRVKETTTTTGTGTVSLAGAPAGFQSFNTAFVNGSLVYYVIQGGAEWEIGIGTTGTGTLARTQVLQSSNADALVPFSAGVKDVFCSYVADRAVTTVDAATLTNKTLDDYTNNIGANSTHFRIKATGTLSKGTVVKATGYNPGENAIEVAVVTSATDLVLGISEQALTAGQFGLAVVIGELFDVNTNGFTVGNIIYSNGSGGFTETKPSSGLYQALGWIVRANASNGVIAVNVVAPLYVETATNTANTSVLRDGSGNFAAGTITATLSGTATQVSNALTAGTYLTSGGTYNGSAARTFAVDATDANTASKVVARDASGNFSAGTITATLNGAAPAGSLSGTTLAATVVTSSLTSVGTLTSGAIGAGFTAIPDSALATISTAGKVSNSATTAASANTANAIVARDASGNFAAGTITAALAGNATTATTADKVANALTAGTYLTSAGTFDGSAARTFAVDATDANTASKVVARDGSGNFSAGTITAALTGNASTATALQTARNINGVSFNGTADITVTAAAGTLTGTTLASGVTASSLTSVGTLGSLTVSGGATLATSSGNVNVGATVTSATWGKFVGVQAAYPGIVLDSTATSGRKFSLGVDATQWYLRDETASATRFVVDASGNLAVDTNTLYVDAANNRVGVGTASPTERVEVSASNVMLKLNADTNSFAQLGYYENGTLKWNVYNDYATDDYRIGNSSGTLLSLTASGNLGLGVTPSAWASGRVALQIGGTPYIVGPNLEIGSNFYVDSGGYKYATTGVASRFDQNAGFHRWFTAPSGTAGNAITFTQAMTLDASGNLGVGISSSIGARVHAYSTTAMAQLTVDGVGAIKTGINFANGGTAFGQIYFDNNSPYDMSVFQQYSTGSLRFGTNNTERARITSGGYTKASDAGTYRSSTGSYHELRQSSGGNYTTFIDHTGANPYGVFIGFTGASPDNNTEHFLLCQDSTTARCYIWSDGDLANHDGVYGTISDAALKQDIVDATSQWADIKAVRFRKYRMKTDVAADANAPYQLGVIAQELEATSPGLVDEHPNEDGTTTKTVKSSILLMKAAVALQEAMARIETLEQRVLALEA